VREKYFLRIEEDNKLEITLFNLVDMISTNSVLMANESYLSADYMIVIIKLYKSIPISLDTYRYLKDNIESIKNINRWDFIVQYGLEEYFI
jgi:hypothetical protein